MLTLPAQAAASKDNDTSRLCGAPEMIVSAEQLPQENAPLTLWRYIQSKEVNMAGSNASHHR